MAAASGDAISCEATVRRRRDHVVVRALALRFPVARAARDSLAVRGRRPPREAATEITTARAPAFFDPAVFQSRKATHQASSIL